jgi:hypothetical protein
VELRVGCGNDGLGVGVEILPSDVAAGDEVEGWVVSVAEGRTVWESPTGGSGGTLLRVARTKTIMARTVIIETAKSKITNRFMGLNTPRSN